MPIHYCVVAEGAHVRAESSTTAADVGQVARRLIEKIPTERDTRKSYAYEDQNFHYVVDGGVIYLCMADSDVLHRICFALLEDVAERYRGQYADATSAAGFERVLKERMDFYSYDPSGDKITAVKHKIEEVKSTMVGNIEKSLDRGDKIEELVDKTQDLESQSFLYRGRTKKVKKKMRRKNWKCTCVCLFVLLVVIGATVAGLWYFNVLPDVLPGSPNAKDDSGTSITPSSATAHSPGMAETPSHGSPPPMPIMHSPSSSEPILAQSPSSSISPLSSPSGFAPSSSI